MNVTLYHLSRKRKEDGLKNMDAFCDVTRAFCALAATPLFVNE